MTPIDRTRLGTVAYSRRRRLLDANATPSSRAMRLSDHAARQPVTGANEHEPASKGTSINGGCTERRQRAKLLEA